MVQITRALFFFAATSLSFCAPVKRTVDQIKADIASIATQVQTLKTSINAFPATGGTLAAALGIHNTAVALTNTINTATTDTVATAAFSETDGASILGLVEALEPDILEALTGIAAKHDAFAALPIGGIPALILQDLQKLDVATASFADALIAKSPESLLTQANAIKSNIAAAFDDAIAAYS